MPSILGPKEDAVLDRLKTLDLTPKGDEKMQLIREILRLARDILVKEQDAEVPYSERSCFLHPEILPRVKEIGERLWEITKDDDPDYMHWFLQCDLESVPRSFHSEIGYAWNGIGRILA